MSNYFMLKIQFTLFYIWGWNMCFIICDSLMENWPWNNCDILKILFIHMGLIKRKRNRTPSVSTFMKFFSLCSYDVLMAFICADICTFIHFAWEAMSHIPPLSFILICFSLIFFFLYTITHSPFSSCQDVFFHFFLVTIISVSTQIHR